MAHRGPPPPHRLPTLSPRFLGRGGGGGKEGIGWGYGPLDCANRCANPEGIPSLSPGLHRAVPWRRAKTGGTRYPGCAKGRGANPERVVSGVEQTSVRAQYLHNDERTPSRQRLQWACTDGKSFHRAPFCAINRAWRSERKMRRRWRWAGWAGQVRSGGRPETLRPGRRS